MKMLAKISEDWTAPDNFYVYFQVNIEINAIAESYELFSFIVVSPRRLGEIAGESGLEIGRGYLITNDYNIKIIEETVVRIIDISKIGTDEQIINNLSKFFKWEMDTI